MFVLFCLFVFRQDQSSIWSRNNYSLLLRQILLSTPLNALCIVFYFYFFFSFLSVWLLEIGTISSLLWVSGILLSNSLRWIISPALISFLIGILWFLLCWILRLCMASAHIQFSLWNCLLFDIPWCKLLALFFYLNSQLCLLNSGCSPRLPGFHSLCHGLETLTFFLPHLPLLDSLLTLEDPR